MFAYTQRTVPGHRDGGQYRKPKAHCKAIFRVGSFIRVQRSIVIATFNPTGVLLDKLNSLLFWPAVRLGPFVNTGQLFITGVRKWDWCLFWQAEPSMRRVQCSAEQSMLVLQYLNVRHALTCLSSAAPQLMSSNHNLFFWLDQHTVCHQELHDKIQTLSSSDDPAKAFLLKDYIQCFCTFSANVSKTLHLCMATDAV